MEICQAVKKYISQQYLNDDLENLTPQTPLFELGILNSMTFFELIKFLEEQFSIVVEDHEYIPDYFATIDRIKNFIELKLTVVSAR